MAYYDDGKHKFSTLITSCKEKTSKAYLKIKLQDWFGDKRDGCIEQWLYNQDATDIELEFKGFIKGYLFKTKKYTDYDLIVGFRDILPKLAKIYIEMAAENNWGKSENLTDWNNLLDVYGKYNKD